MLLIFSSITRKKIIVYIVLFLTISMYICLQTAPRLRPHESRMQELEINLINPEAFIKAFMLTDNTKFSYVDLLAVNKLFDSNFTTANDKQRILFKIYYSVALSAKHPDLYKKLYVLEEALQTLNLEIINHPNLYDFRLARIKIHQALPLYFRDIKLIKRDISYLETGYFQQKKFEFTNGFRELTIKDLIW